MNPRRLRFETYWVLAIAFACTLLVFPTHVFSQQDPAPSDGALSDSVWYDAETRQMIPIEVRNETSDSANRDSRWLPKARKLRERRPATAPGAAGTAATGILGTGLTASILFGWGLVILTVAAIIAMFIYVATGADFSGASSSSNGKKTSNSGLDEHTLQRVKHLPAELRRTDVNMRDEAERLMKEGRFDQAIILLFGHQLLLLDRAGILRLNRSKTNGRYVRETRASNPNVASQLRSTVDSFERSYFGRHEIRPEEFADLWQLNLEMEAEVAGGEGVAA